MARSEAPESTSGEVPEIRPEKPGTDVGLVTSVLTTHVSGPIPSPKVLKEDDEVLPGCAERIISVWETENQHRRQLDLSILEQDTFRAEQHYRVQIRGQIFAFSLAILFFTGSMLLVYQGHSTGGIAVLIGEIVALVGVFIFGRRRQTESAESDEESNSDRERAQ